MDYKERVNRFLTQAIEGSNSSLAVISEPSYSNDEEKGVCSSPKGSDTSATSSTCLDSKKRPTIKTYKEIPKITHNDAITEDKKPEQKQENSNDLEIVNEITCDNKKISDNKQGNLPSSKQQIPESRIASIEEVNDIGESVISLPTEVTYNTVSVIDMTNTSESPCNVISNNTNSEKIDNSVENENLSTDNDKTIKDTSTPEIKDKPV